MSEVYLSSLKALTALLAGKKIDEVDFDTKQLGFNKREVCFTRLPGDLNSIVFYIEGGKVEFIVRNAQWVTTGQIEGGKVHYVTDLDFTYEPHSEEQERILEEWLKSWRHAYAYPDYYWMVKRENKMEPLR